MQIQNEPSPMLRAIDLLRVNVDEMGLQDLECHMGDVLGTIAALNEYINSGVPKSHDSLLNALRLNRKLSLHMARVRDCIQACKSINAMTQGVPTGSSPALSAMPLMGRRSRVIRPLPSADNATSGPLEISGDEPTAQSPEARRGGEAKERGAHPQSGEASLQAKR